MSTDRLSRSFANPFGLPATAELIDRILQDIFDPRDPVRPPARYDAPLESGAPMMDIETVLSAVRTLVVQQAVYPRHPHALAHMVPPPASISVVADLVIGALNQCAFIWEEAPMAQAVEREVIRWLAEAAGFDAEGSGVITSGGTMSNLLATYLALSRWRRIAPSGVAPCVLASDQAHLSIDKAAALTGLPPSAVIRVRTDEEGRVHPGQISEAATGAARRGMRPFLVVCTAGTTNAGTLEPIDEALDVAYAHEAWCHVDAAHGGVMCLVPHLLPEDSPVRRWREADSLSWDAHKGLYASYAVGSLLVRDPSDLDALGFHADYALKRGARADAGINHFEGSRRFEALKLWMIIKHFGKQGLSELTAHNCELARLFAGRLRRSSSFAVLTDPDTNIVCFRYEAAGRSPTDLDRLNGAIQTHAFSSGGPLLSTTSVTGRVFMRAVFLNPATTTGDLKFVTRALERIGAMLANSRNPVTEVSDHESVASY
jgi:L-2,4-diaminobutyrate decarboxylase